MEPKAKEEPFNFNLVIKYCAEACSNPEDIPIEPFCLAMNEYTKLLKLLGSAMSLAFSDITSKTGALMGHIQTYKTQIKGLMSLIQLELRLGVQNLSGENNHKLTKNKNLLKYESGARTTLRLMWFMDFMTVMFRELIADPKLSYPKTVKKAYNEALGPHHELIYRLAAQAGFLIAPGRDLFYTNFCGIGLNEEVRLNLMMIGKGKSEKECFEIFQGQIDALKPLREILWNYYNLHKLTKLP